MATDPVCAVGTGAPSMGCISSRWGQWPNLTTPAALVVAIGLPTQPLAHDLREQPVKNGEISYG